MGQDDFYFDEEAADRVCRFFETQLFHWKGKFAGQPFTLLRWERKILRDVWGWRRKSDGTRKTRFIYCEIPRKSGKTFFASGVALALFLLDGEPGAEVYACANSTAQSFYTLDNAKKMVAASPILRKRVKPYRWHLEHPKSKSTFKALSGENVGSHGKNTHGLILDEVHEMNSPAARDLYEALMTSFGARSNYLTLAITTAGHGGDDSICHELHDKAVAYLSGEKKPGDEDYDETFYPVIYGADAAEPWDDPAVWAKANPSLGETVPVSYYQTECIKAKESPSYENSFRRLYLNQWTEQATRWLSLETYDACTANLNPADYYGQPCIVGVDLSESFDLTAVVSVYVQPGRWVVIPRFYIPRDTAERRQRDDNIKYLDWIKAGHVIEAEPVAGRTATINYEQVQRDILDIARHSRVIEAAFDQRNANAITNTLDQAGLVTVNVPQGWGLSPACKQFEMRLTNRQIVLPDWPALRHQAAAIEVLRNSNGDIRPVKPGAKGKSAGQAKYSVDGLVATLIATSRAMLRPDLEQGGNDFRAVYL